MKGETEFTDSNDTQAQPIDMQHHREALRRALLASPHWNKKQGNVFTELFPFLKVENKTMLKRITAVGITFGVLAIVLVAALVLTSNANVASAKEIAQKSYLAISALPPDQQGALKQTINEDPGALLTEAKNAKDLKTLTFDQVVSQYPEIGENPAPAPNGKTADVRSLRFLQFTDSSGDTVLLGIGDDNLPTLTLHWSGLKPGETPDGAKGVKGSLRNDGSGPVYEYNGKKYTVPAGSDSTGGRMDVRVEGDDVYINGQKATPVQ